MKLDQCCLAFVVGWCGFAHGEDSGFRLIGKPPGYRAQSVRGISMHGDLVVGFSNFGPVGQPDISFEYGFGIGRVDSEGPETSIDFVGLSPNARWLAIYDSRDIGIATHAANRSNGQQVTSALPSGYSEGFALAVSDLGDSAGHLTFELYPGVGSRHATWVSGEGQLTILSAVPGQFDLYSAASAISADGHVVVGSVAPTAGSGIGVVWTDGSPTWLRGLLADNAHEGVNAWGMSTDGKFVAGSARAALPGVTWTIRHAALWRTPADVLDLAPGTAFTSEAWAVADDGATVVGYMDVYDPALGQSRWNAMIWTPETGMVLLADYLATAGIVVPASVRLAGASLISCDGRTIAGTAYDGPDRSSTVGFVVRLPPPTCYADFNADGGIDGSDIEPFFAAWEGGEPAADVNQDGGVDMGDVQAFFTQWESGACGR